MAAEEILQALERDPIARLRWRVFRETGLRGLSRRRLILCACHMLLDRAGERGMWAEDQNAAFDQARFQRLKRGEAL